MSNNRTTRRTVLSSCGALIGAGLGTATAGASESETVSGSAETTTAGLQQQTGIDSRTGIYSGTVDRIVDGEHVVILLEEDGRAIDQVVLDRERTPDATEGDSAQILLWSGTVLRVWID